VKYDKFTFFWSGPFSQWYPATFKVNGVTYNCAEQYMMARKAQLFGDIDSLAAIMRSSSPKEQKALGRKVRGFDARCWNSDARLIVYAGNKAKFEQNDELRAALYDTAGTELVEASPYDKIWGIGLGEHDPDAKDRTKWRGTNWLGEVLTTLRDDMMRKDGQ